MPDWPHSPIHRFAESGSYIVTAATLNKEHLFRAKSRMDYLHDQLLARCAELELHLQAWAVFSNHYHFVCFTACPEHIETLCRGLHRDTAIQVNEADGTVGRHVWFNYWDTRLTSSRSYFARMRYVQENPVRHRLVTEAAHYPWCSAKWFRANAPGALQRTVASFKIDRVKVADDYDPVMPE